MGSKKRRRNGGRVNKRRNLNDVREKYSKKSPFGSKVMLKAWDFGKTVNQNYEQIGLLGGNLNDLPRRDDNLTDKGKPAPLGPDSILPKKPIQFIDGFLAKDLPSLRQQLDARASGESSRGANHMTELQIAYIEPLVTKYGTDYNKMWRDPKNYKQETRDKLRRRCERYLSLKEQEEIDRREAEEEEEEEEEDSGSGSDSGSDSDKE